MSPPVLLSYDGAIAHVTLNRPQARNAVTIPLAAGLRDALLGESLWEQFPAAVGSDFERYYRQAVETGQPVTFEAPSGQASAHDADMAPSSP